MLINLGLSSPVPWFLEIGYIETELLQQIRSQIFNVSRGDFHGPADLLKKAIFLLRCINTVIFIHKVLLLDPLAF
jgi:hypothetical protein